MRLRPAATAVIVGLAVAGLAGCAKAKPAAPPTTNPTASASSQNPRALAESMAIAAYVNLWQAMAKAGEVPDPNDPAY